MSRYIIAALSPEKIITIIESKTMQDKKITNKLFLKRGLFKYKKNIKIGSILIIKLPTICSSENGSLNLKIFSSKIK